MVARVDSKSAELVYNVAPRRFVAWVLIVHEKDNWFYSGKYWKVSTIENFLVNQLEQSMLYVSKFISKIFSLSIL